jgi:hypothetical protein
MVTGNRDGMPEDEGIGTHLHFFQDEPDDSLAIEERERVCCFMELGEKPFQTLGERHIRLGVRQLRLEGRQLRFGHRLSL